MVKKRNIGVSILLTLITCGIYGIFWYVYVSDELEYKATDQANNVGVKAILLSLVTCGIYGIYWNYKLGEKLDILKTKRGRVSSESAVLFLVLCLFGLGIISIAIIQSELNKDDEQEVFLEN